jgi:hypothetical protein
MATEDLNQEVDKTASDLHQDTDKTTNELHQETDKTASDLHQETDKTTSDLHQETDKTTNDLHQETDMTNDLHHEMDTTTNDLHRKTGTKTRDHYRRTRTKTFSALVRIGMQSSPVPQNAVVLSLKTRQFIPLGSERGLNFLPRRMNYHVHADAGQARSRAKFLSRQNHQMPQVLKVAQRKVRCLIIRLFEKVT